jgi:hypothetical protein
MKRVTIDRAKERIVFWRLVLDLMREAHTVHFAGRRFGKDREVFTVFAAALGFYAEGQNVRSSKIAQFLDMPTETARRDLNRLVKLGLFVRDGFDYVPTDKAAHHHIADFGIKKVKEAASRL